MNVEESTPVIKKRVGSIKWLVKITTCLRRKTLKLGQKSQEVQTCHHTTKDPKKMASYWPACASQPASENEQRDPDLYVKMGKMQE